MRGRLRRAAPLVMAAFFMTAGSASAATTLPTPVSTPCPAYGGVQVCSYEVPSFDGQPLDVDLTLPVTKGAHHPLIVMLHGFGNNKHEWESTTDAGDGADKYDWNNHWFAEHGYYVLTYTARGFQDRGTTGSYEPATPAGAPCGSDCGPFDTIHVKSRDYEIHDTQWLAALAAATVKDLDTKHVAVTGGSYGGGESWLQASQADWTFPESIDPSLPVLRLQVAVPKYPWTDLAYSLAPSGHGGGPSHQDIYESSQTVPTTQTGEDPPGIGNPLGVPKASYIAGLYALGTETGTFDEGVDEPFDENGPENITAWNARITGTGDPYPMGDPVLLQAARGLTVLRSAYYQTAGWASELANRDEVAVFSVQGWTDDLFEPVESFRIFKYLKRLDPLWPVTVTVADVGHSRAQNPPAQWQEINAQAWRFLEDQITGSHRESTTVTSMPTVCASEPDQTGATTSQVVATTPEGLANGTLAITYGGGTHTLVNPLGVVDPNGPATDPIVGRYFDSASPGDSCRTSEQPTPPGAYTGTSQALTRESTYVDLGEVDVPYTVTPAVTQAQIDARVWDVPPRGPAYLMTRGTYRLDTLNGYDRPTGTLRLPLYGNEWKLAPGHAIRLDLTQDDSPTLRPNNLPSSIAFGSPVLELPTVEAGTQSLTGTP